jgi:hypothetical protein
VKPASLKKYAENVKRVNNVAAQREQEAFVEKARKSEAADKHAKEQQQHLKQLNEIIEGRIMFDNGRGQVDYTKNERVTKECEAIRDKAVANKSDLAAACRQVIALIETRYEEVERARERV